MVLKLNLFLKEAVMFGLAQIIGIYSAANLIASYRKVDQIPSNFSGFSPIDFLILAGTIILFIFFSKRGGRAGTIFYKAFLSLALFAGSQIALQSFTGPSLSIIISTVLVTAFIIRNNILVHNAIMILAIAGIGAAFGTGITPPVALSLLTALSIYDIVAVYKTKHMIKLAETMIKSKAIFGFVIPSRLSMVGKKIDDVTPGDDFMILGSGDIVMPIVLASSVLSDSIVHSLFISSFSIIGLFLTHILFNSQKIRQPMAALPPIAATSIIGYLAAQFFI